MLYIFELSLGQFILQVKCGGKHQHINCEVGDFTERTVYFRKSFCRTVIAGFDSHVSGKLISPGLRCDFI